MRFLRTRRASRGAVLPIVALLLPVFLIITAMAVDLGRQRNDRRSMQSAADVIALDMARLANGRTIDAIALGDADNPATETALQASADRNEIDRSQVVLQWGTTDAAGAFTPLNLGTDIPDTAEITASDTTDYFFQPGSGDVERVARAQYGAEALAGFKVGSFGASVDPTQAGLLNSLVTPLLGNPVGLDALSYQGLAGAEVNIFELGNELGLLTPDDVLNTTVDFDDVVLASADILERNGDSANATLLRNSITTEMQNMDVQLGQFVDADTGGEGPGMAAGLNVLGMLTGTAFAAQCTPDPIGFADCSGLSLPNVAANVPLVSSTSSLKVIQGPQYAYGPVGASAKTGQVQLTMNTVVGGQNVGACVPRLANLFCVLSGIGLVGQVAAVITVDATVTLAGGLNSITDIGCTDPLAETLLISSNTDLYDISLQVGVEYGKSGGLGGLLGGTIGAFTLSGSTSSVNAADSELFTVPPDVLGVTTRSTGNGNVGLSGIALTASGNTGTVLGSLANLGLNFVLADVLSGLVNPLLGQIDSQLLGPLTKIIGANVTGSDLTPEQIDCSFGNVMLVG
ncbi:pilus assembly protein TadG-related protein [Actinospongicola halichondriae]|uniref:pilus assembly protein TadG-related protein n=1 Tax=Actinospongicola halichondriae TaxID=3236844 RepID=UPI003D59B8DC